MDIRVIFVWGLTPSPYKILLADNHCRWSGELFGPLNNLESSQTCEGQWEDESPMICFQREGRFPAVKFTWASET